MAGLCVAAQGCSGCSSGGSGSGGAQPAGDPAPGTVLSRVAGGGDGDPAGPTVASVAVQSDQPAGDIPLDVTIAGARDGAVALAVEVSRDGGQSFRPASTEALGGGSGATADGHVHLVWHSIADVGFRAPVRAELRVAARDGQGSGASAVFATPPLDNFRAAARRVDSYVANYGRWTPEGLEIAKQAQLVIADTRQHDLSRDRVAALQAGVDPDDPGDDVLVLCYVSIGEDLRTVGVSDDQLRGDPRFRGDGTGPRIDPRGPAADGASLAGIDPRGVPSNGGTGFASFYLDDNSVHNSPDQVGDGIPDRNSLFGALFVNAGDPAWFDAVDTMTTDGVDGIPGLREVLTADYGRGLDCDGVFLDTVDTAAPNSFTDASSANESKFEWTAPGFAAFIKRVHATYPNKLVLQNRGLFFFDPRHPHYEWNARGAIDFVLFESYRLDSNPADEANAYQYPDNQYNIAPKLMAEANRPDGFRVLSLGYAVGPPDGMSIETLLGRSTLGLQSLLEDIHVTQDLAGFRHYLTDAKVQLVNDFVRTHADLSDHDPPVWTSTYNDHVAVPPVEPTPRVGIQAASGGGGRITVQWDVAMDKNRVRYVLYAQPQPFDFGADPQLAAATRTVLVPTVPPDYTKGVGPDRYPYQANVAGFPAGQTQYLIIRAVDESPAANQDTNTVVLTATP